MICNTMPAQRQSGFSATAKPQYQHYVPQFILRKFSDYVAPVSDGPTCSAAYQKANTKAKNKASVNVMDFRDGFSKARVHSQRCAKTFGIPDMYNAEIEKALSILEQESSMIINRIEADFLDGKSTTTLTRTHKEKLRKFAFVMLYRSDRFRRRYTIDKNEYEANDRSELLAYLEEKGFETPRDVWLANIRAFIDIDVTQASLRWYDELKTKAYPADATWFWNNMAFSYLCFCTPDDATDEFLLTQNAYGVFEGPSYGKLWLNWHNFAPINNRLIMVLRNNCLSSLSDSQMNMEASFNTRRKQTITKLTALFPDQEAARSWLGSMPVSRALPSYQSPLPVTKDDMFFTPLDPEHTFTFTFNRLPSLYVQRINSIFLEEAIVTETVVYKTPEALCKSLVFYLELDYGNFKTCVQRPPDGTTGLWRIDINGTREVGDKPQPEFQRWEYLTMLERIVYELGGRCSPKHKTHELKTKWLLPPRPPGFSNPIQRAW
jgi:hypothetical protein